MNTKRSIGSLVTASAICFVALAATMHGHLQARAAAKSEDAQKVPVYRVDPFWPKPLPNRWSMQQVTGLIVEGKNDHVWFLNRGAAADGDEIGGGDNPPRIDCCVRGPGGHRVRSRGQCGQRLGRSGLYSPVADRAANRHRGPARATSG